MNDTRPSIVSYIVFLLLVLLVMVPAFWGSYLSIVRGLQGLAEAMRDSGLWSYGILFFQLLVVVFSCVVGFFYLRRDNVPASLLLIPVLLPLIVGLIGANVGLGQAEAAIDQAAPEQALPYAFRGISLASTPIVLGALASSFLALNVALLGAIRTVAEKRKERASVGGIIVLIAGVALCFAAVAVASVLEREGHWTFSMAFVTLLAALFLGLGAIRPLTERRHGANLLLVAVASFAAVALVWIATHHMGTVVLGAALDQAAPDQRMTFMARGLVKEWSADLKGTIFLALISLLALAALALRGRQVLGAAAKFRVNAALFTVTLLAAVALLVLNQSKARAFLESTDRRDSAYFVRLHEDFQPIIVERTEPIGLAGPTVILTPESAWVDDREVVTQDRFGATPEPGPLKTAIDRSVARWQKELPYRGDVTVTLAAHRRVAFGPVRAAAAALYLQGRKQLDLLTSTVNLPRLGDASYDELNRPPLRRLLRPYPWDFGTLDLGLASAAECQAARRDPEDIGLSLVLDIREDGFVIGASGGILPPGACTRAAGGPPTGPTIPLVTAAATCTDLRGYPRMNERAKRRELGLGPPPCAYDFERLHECVLRIKEEYPEERQVLIGSAPRLDFETSVRAIEAVRGRRDSPLFPDAVLYVGDGVLDHCGPLKQERAGAADIGALRRDKVPDDRIEGGPGVRGKVGRGSARAVGGTGVLSASAVRDTVGRALGGIKGCYERALRRNPTLGGRVTVNFTVGGGGRVVSASTSTNTLTPEVGDCIVGRIRSLRFPPPEGGDVTFSYPFFFQPAR